MANQDSSPVVRLYLASAMQRMSLENRWDIASGLITHAEDADDHNLPKLIWYGIEPLVPENPSRAMELAQASQLPLVTEYIARRATDARQLETLSRAMGKIKSEATINNMLVGFSAGLKGINEINTPASWPETYEKIEKYPLAKEIAAILGDTESNKAFISTLDNPKANIDERRNALKNLASKKHMALKSRLIGLLDNNDLSNASIQAMALYSEKSFSQELLERYPNMNVEEKSATIQTMASRASYAQNLTDAIKSGVVPRNDLPEYIVQKMRRIAGPRFVDIWSMAKSSGVVKSGEKFQITISTIEGKMLYDIKEFEVKTGDSVSLKFRNMDFPPHNLLIVKPGKADEVAKMAIELGDKGFSKQWRPDTKLILWSSTALNHKEEDLIKFIAPEPGNYPYVCTFPGHAMMMRGVMKVVPR